MTKYPSQSTSRKKTQQMKCLNRKSKLCLTPLKSRSPNSLTPSPPSLCASLNSLTHSPRETMPIRSLLMATSFHSRSTMLCSNSPKSGSKRSSELKRSLKDPRFRHLAHPNHEKNSRFSRLDMWIHIFKKRCLSQDHPKSAKNRLCENRPPSSSLKR